MEDMETKDTEMEEIVVAYISGLTQQTVNSGHITFSNSKDRIEDIIKKTIKRDGDILYFEDVRDNTYMYNIKDLNSIIFRPSDKSSIIEANKYLKWKKNNKGRSYKEYIDKEYREFVDNWEPDNEDDYLPNYNDYLKYYKNKKH